MRDPRPTTEPNILCAVLHWASVNGWLISASGGRRPEIEQRNFASAWPLGVRRVVINKDHVILYEGTASGVADVFTLLPAHALAWSILEGIGQLEIAKLLLATYRDGAICSSRAELEVTADRLLAEGDQLGDLLSHALQTWCQLTRPVPREWWNADIDRDLEALGILPSIHDLRHTAAAVDWLELLTAEHPNKRARQLAGLDVGANANPCGEIVLGPPQPNALVHGEQLTVEVAGFAYTYVGDHPDAVTAAELVEQFNAQGGPASFRLTDEGSITVQLYGTGSHMVTVRGGTAAARLGLDGDAGRRERRRAELRERRAQHAPHIGGRLGRRLGVRR